MKTIRKLAALSIVLLIPFQGLLAANFSPQTDKDLSWRQFLHTKPEGKATVGVVPYTLNSGEVYILLGREDINSDNKKKAGTYADFGGSTNEDQTYLDNMLRELREETMGFLTPTGDYILDNSKFVTKDNNGRKIIYSLMPAGKKYFIEASKITRYRAKNKNKLTRAEIEKDEFAWLPLKKLISSAKNGAYTVNLKDIDGAYKQVRLRKFFAEDFLKNENLGYILEDLR
jgi:ADP-ribose pyrophosphatase YjhB (NUDIX family)